MRTTMGNPACGWVRARLPLWVGAGIDPTEPGGEGGDLSPEERRSIDRHLGTCPACRRHLTALERALGALACAAAAPPLPHDAPSLWPALQRRIESDHARAGAPWSRMVRGIAERGLRAWAALVGERSLRGAGMCDSLRAAIEIAGRDGSLALRGGRMSGGPSELPGVGAGSGRGSRRRSGLVVGLGAAAALLILMIGMTAARRRQADAEAILLANAAPREGWIIAPATSEPGVPTTLDPVEDREPPAHQLAQAEPIPVLEPPASGSDGPATSRPATPTHFGYDLEHGIPMPPDARDSRAVY